MSHHHEEKDHSHSNEKKIDEHELKGEMIKRLKPFYDHHDLSILEKVKHFIEH
jgi:hypothetical protein